MSDAQFSAATPEQREQGLGAFATPARKYVLRCRVLIHTVAGSPRALTYGWARLTKLAYRAVDERADAPPD
jgi:hypothetical protein